MTVGGHELGSFARCNAWPSEMCDWLDVRALASLRATMRLLLARA
jgi:hypothetical protein